MRHSVIAGLLACTVIFGPERFPLDGGTHTEIRAQFCAHTWVGVANAFVTVEMRTYERTQNKDGTYTVTVLSNGEDGWTAAATIPLYVTTKEPAP